jgi:CubicO group peptidase (beta-lactamase class C family)
MIEQAFAPAAAAIAEGRIPGATLGIVHADGRRAVRHAGMAALVPEPEVLTEAHWFDLASLTKVIATTTIILTLAEQGRIDLDRPLTDAIPDLRQYDVANAAERRLTFRDCLAHRTFLPAVEPIYTYDGNPDRLRAFVLQREWRHGPPVYSDINFILLGIAIERITGQPLSAWPLGTGLRYGPPPGPAVASEACSWRGRVMKGEVHDENCYALGGATGHAGLFGTVAGVLDFAQGLLDGQGASPAMVAAIRTLQTYLSRPVMSGSDPQGLGPEIIKLQTYLSTVVAGGQPSGFKFEPTKVKKAVADYDLVASIIQLQVAADLT